MNLPIIILGAGGHAHVVFAVLRQTGSKILGALAPNAVKFMNSKDALPVLGDDDMIEAYSPSAVTLVNGIGSVDQPKKRQIVFSKFKAKGFSFATVIHPSVITCKSVHFGEGAQAMAGAIVQSGVTIGDNVLVNTGTILEHDCKIGDHVHLATGAILCGGVEVGPESHIGAGSTIKQGIQIGAGSVIGAGAVVIRDVPANTTVAGVPAGELKQ